MTTPNPLVLNPARNLASPTRRLLAIVRPDRSDIWSVVVFSILVGALMLATPVAVQALVNFVAFGASIPPLLILSLLLLLGLAAAAGVSALQAWIVETFQRRIFVRVVADLSRRLPIISRSVSDRHYAPELVNRFFDVMTVQKVSSTLLLEGLGNVLGIIVGLVVLAFYHPLLLAFDLVLVAAVAAVVLVPMRLGVRTAINESKAKYAVVGWLEELARNPIGFRSGGTNDYIERRSEALARDYVTARRSQFRVVFGQIIAALSLQVLASVTLLAIGGLLVVRGELTLGQLVASELIVTVVVQSVAKMGKHIESYYDLIAAVDKLGQLLDLETEASTGSVVPTARGPAKIEICDISLKASSDRRSLSSLSSTIEAGETVAISGDSGSGRSLLLEMLYGLRKGDSGSISIDGVDYRDVDLEALRRDVALASSLEPIDESILLNVTLGRPGIEHETVTKTLQSLGLFDDIRDLPDGLATRLGPSGVPLSQSQLRRLMLARAIVGAPRLLMVDGLFDDAADVARPAVLETLLAENRPWTLIVVTNEPDLVSRCDRNLVLTTAGKEPS